MEYDTGNIENKDIPPLLRWYMDCGVDEAIGDETLDWFALSGKTTRKPPVRKTAPRVSVDQIAERTEKMAASSNSLADLYEMIKNFDGCRLKNTATHTVFSDGNPDSNIMLIGEAPGVDEDRRGTPFVGKHGQLLDRMFKAIDLTREKDFYITNILPWRPPGNRNPTQEEITICLPFIKRHIELFDPKLIILLGGTSATNLLNSKLGITRLRGKWTGYGVKGSNIPVRAIFHPAYLLRQPKAKGDTWADLLEIKTMIKESHI